MKTSGTLSVREARALGRARSLLSAATANPFLPSQGGSAVALYGLPSPFGARVAGVRAARSHHGLLYTAKMTRPLIDSATLARQSERVLRRDQRRVARDAARNLVVETLDALAKEEPPDWFNARLV